MSQDKKQKKTKSKYQYVKENLVFTNHGNLNLRKRRRDITKSHVAMCIAYGVPRLVNREAGHDKLMRSYYDKLGVEVVYKIDNKGKYVVITHYRVHKTKRNRAINKIYDYKLS